MRLVLAENASFPFANAVVPTGGSEVPLTTPSGAESGLKVNVNITIEPNQVSRYVIDFDACESVVKAGSSAQYLLKPVFTVIRVVGEAGQRIVGYIDPATLGTATSVSAQSGGVVVKATVPDAGGRFVLYPVPPGDYNLVIASTGRTTAVMRGVPVTLSTTYIGSDSARVLLGDSPTRNAAGIVTLNASMVNTGRRCASCKVSSAAR